MLQKKESSRFAKIRKRRRSQDGNPAASPESDRGAGSTPPASTAALQDLRNATPSRLHITDADGRTLVFAPLEQRGPTASEPRWTWEGLIRRGFVVPVRSAKKTRLDGGKARSRRQLHTVTLLSILVISVAVPVLAFSTELVKIDAPDRM